MLVQLASEASRKFEIFGHLLASKTAVRAILAGPCSQFSQKLLGQLGQSQNLLGQLGQLGTAMFLAPLAFLSMWVTAIQKIPNFSK